MLVRWFLCWTEMGYVLLNECDVVGTLKFGFLGEEKKS